MSTFELMKVFDLCIFELMYIFGQAREMLNTTQMFQECFTEY